MESRSCSRMSREATVLVISRMRSASVDLPWSMWAMIEKLRMRLWSDKRPPRIEVGRGRPASRSAASRETPLHHVAQLLGLGQAHGQHDVDVGRRAEGQPAAHGDDLAQEATAEDPV